MRKNYPLYICIFSFLILNILLISNNIKTKNNQEDYFRMHIVANSNTVDDQIIKLNVVNKVNEYLSGLYTSSKITNNKDSAKNLITTNIYQIIQVANSELKYQNADYLCSANIGRISYDAKTSDSINMNKGIYDSIQIVLGEGKGENFWSLIFPYSYNPSYNMSDTSTSLLKDEIEIKSGILETIKKAVKTFKS